MIRPQFMLKDVFLAVALIAIGCAGISMLLRLDGIHSLWGGTIAAMLYGTSPIWICMGLAAPFRRKRLGAAIGLAMTILAVLAAPGIQ